MKVSCSAWHHYEKIAELHHDIKQRGELEVGHLENISFANANQVLLELNWNKVAFS